MSIINVSKIKEILGKFFKLPDYYALHAVIIVFLTKKRNTFSYNTKEELN